MYDKNYLIDRFEEDFQPFNKLWLTVAEKLLENNIYGRIYSQSSGRISLFAKSTSLKINPSLLMIIILRIVLPEVGRNGGRKGLLCILMSFYPFVCHYAHLTPDQGRLRHSTGI